MTFVLRLQETLTKHVPQRQLSFLDQIHGILDLDLGFKVYGLGFIIEDLQVSMMFSPYLGCCTTERRT